MRLLLDECVPRRLRRELSDHEVRTVPEMGWAAKQNGDTLKEELGKKPQDCLLCGLTKEMQEMTRIPGRGSICSTCLDEVRAVIEHLKECKPRQTT